MEIIKPRAAFLSNYEVYSLLQELEHKQLEQTRAIMAIKKEESLEDQYKGPNFVQNEEVAENVRTIQVEMLQYLNGDGLPTSRQSEESVAHLTRGLRKYGLTKAEKLQIVNLCPETVIELYIIVEELDVRFSEDVQDMLALVKEKLTAQTMSSADLGDSTLEGEPVAEVDEDANMWGDDEPVEYLEDDFEGGDDFVPGLELDEEPDQRD